MMIHHDERSSLSVSARCIQMIFFIFALLLLVATSIATPTPATNDDPNSIDIQTSFLDYLGCSVDNVTILKTNIDDSVRLANSGLRKARDELSTNAKARYIDSSQQAAIDFFGPESKNKQYQEHITGE
jgi:hypothetical protein